jgi:hypothetical protein
MNYRIMSAVLGVSALLGVGFVARKAFAFSHTCQLVQVDYWNLAGEERVVAQCSTAHPSGYTYFAVSAASSNAVVANRFLSMMTTALISKRDVYLYWDNVGTAVPGCQLSNCRSLKSWSIK